MKIEMANLTSHAIHEFLTRAVAPLPITLISTVGEDGVFNAAPYSLAVPVSYKPPLLVVSFGTRRGQKKDTVRNIEYTRDFVVNIMDESLIQKTVQTSFDYPSNVDEIKEAGLTALSSDKVKSPRIAEAQVSLECKFMQGLTLGEEIRFIVFGEVVLAHVQDKLWSNGNVDPYKLKNVGRLGSGIYCPIRDIFKMKPS